MADSILVMGSELPERCNNTLIAVYTIISTGQKSWINQRYRNQFVDTIDREHLVYNTPNATLPSLREPAFGSTAFQFIQVRFHVDS